MAKSNDTTFKQIVLSVVHLMFFLFALYLSFCHNRGISFSVLFACCCPQCYVMYMLAVHGLC